MRYLTFDQWRAEGYSVMYGERSHKRGLLGEALFNEMQVQEIDGGSFDPMAEIDSLFDADSDDPLGDPFLFT